MADHLGIKDLAGKLGFGLEDSKTIQELGGNLDLGQIVDNTSVDGITEKIREGAIASVLKYEGDNTTFVWKHPIEDFNTGTTLIVHESQEAIFFMNGEALDLFGPGRHTLETQNLPLVRKFFSAPTGGVTPFHCELYFINKTEQMAIKWGTDSKIEYMEPVYNFPIQIGASGEMSLSVSDSRKLLVKLVGTERNLTQTSLVQKLRTIMLTEVKTNLASQIKKNSISIFEMDEHLSALSKMLLTVIAPDFGDYGINLERFIISTIVKPEDDRLYKQFRELHIRKYTEVAEAKLQQELGVIEQETLAKKTMIEARGIAQKRAIEGYSYQQERSFDVAEKLAQNEATGQMANVGIGLGVMSGVGGTMGQSIGGMVSESMGEAAKAVTNEPQKEPFEARVAKLELLKGKISEEMYQEKMKELLEEI